MPYADPERQRDAVKRWQQAHPEKLKAYRKTMFMKNYIDWLKVKLLAAF